MATELSELEILVVDDEPFVVTLAVRMLGKLGITTVSTATNGEDALAQLDAGDFHPDVILCDLNMPGMDGIAFLRHLSERDLACAVGLVSGEDKRVLQSVADLADAHRLKVLGHLSKPLGLPPLQGLLEKALAVDGGGRGGGGFTSLTPEQVEAGIAAGYVEPYFQPKVEVATGRLVSVEALARWRDPDGGLLGPGAFIPVAEENGLIDDLTEAVMAQAFECGANWAVDGLLIKVAVNVSMESLKRLDYPEWVVGMAGAAGMDPTQVILEVTESRLMEDVAATLEILSRLRLKGIGLAIDDYGTGFSTMQQLKRIPFTELKVDGSFVTGAPSDGEARAMLESSVGLAKALDLTLVAEGVEEKAEWDLVAAVGGDVVQGYFVAKPMPGDQIPAWNEKWSQEWS